MTNNKDPSDKDWRQRYLKQTDDTEALENRYNEHVELLQRIISRLCLTVDESSTQLHDEIRSLRGKLKGEHSSLPSLAESLSEIDKRLLSQQQEEASIKVSLPADTATKKIKTSVWSRVMDKLHAVASPLETAGGETIEGRIEVVPEDFVELPGADKLKEVLESTPGYGAIASKVADILNGMLSQLNYPESAQSDLQALRLRIASRVNWYELPPTLEDVSNLVLASLGRGQRQFDGFLAVLDAQLESMTEFLHKHDDRDQTWLDLSKQLRESIEGQYDELSSMADAEYDHEDFERRLKTSIHEHLEQITQITVEHVRRGEKLSVGFRPELEKMRDKVRTLSSEQKALRKTLKEDRKQALTDPLTKLSSREAYDERLEFEFLRWQRYRKPVVLVAADIDHFKDINDQYGHLSGDRTLQIIGKELRQRLRKTDFIARYGGEKFVFILPVTELDVAREVIEKLRVTIANLPFHFKAKRVQLTVSFGLVPFTECVHFSELNTRAQAALLQAKQNGRNCVYCED